MATATKVSPSRQRTFRPWPANQFVLQRAEKVGFNVSELLNEIVEKHLRGHIERKAAAQVRAARSIKPAKLSKQSRHSK